MSPQTATLARSRQQTPQQVSRPHDPDEREARHVAEVVAQGGSVMGWSFSSVPITAASSPAKAQESAVSDQAAIEHAGSCGCGGTCPTCRRAIELLRANHSGSAPPAVDSAHVDSVLRAPGELLGAKTRSFFESRLGANFSDVRVHADAQAARSADALDAHAYAIGRHIVFGTGEYRPDSSAGRRLLAHELVHVAQQEAGGERIQRDEKEEKGAIDVAVVLDGNPESEPAGRALAPNVIRVFNSSDLAAKLKQLGAPIRTLFVVSHSSSAGEVQFESKEGIISWVKLAEVAKDIRGALPADKAPQLVDFRGCKLGEATEELGKFRIAVGARSVTASNCWSFDNAVGPVSLGGVAITGEGQLNKDNAATFDKGLGMLVERLKSEDGRPVKDCILGLSPGESASSRSAFTKIRKQYFAGKGSLTAEWVSPEFNKTWQPGSRCVKDLTESTTPCKRTTKTAQLEPSVPGEGRAKTAAAEPLEAAPETQEAGA